MTDLMLGFATLAVVFILVIVLCIQIQMRKLDEKIDKVLNKLDA